MSTTLPTIPDGLRARLERRPDGLAWLEALPGSLHELSTRWQIELGYGLELPTASLVIRGRRRGHPVVLKLCPPWGNVDRERAVLEAARGRGYIKLFDADVAHRALLLEPVGEPLDSGSALLRDAGRGVRAMVTATLAQAWTVPLATVADPGPGQNPGERLTAALLAGRTGCPAPECGRAIDRALAYADQRLADRDPGREVVVHGNPRLWNLRAVPAPRAGAETGYVFVEPLGLRCDREYDLGAALLEGHRWLLSADDPVVLARQWCAELAEASGCDAEVVWQWSYVQRVAHALALLDGPERGLGLSQLRTAVALISRTRG